MYPDDSVQSFTKDWWIDDQGGSVARGRLIRAFVPYPEMKPHRLIPEDRGDDPRQHARARFRLEPFRVGDPPARVGTLPVAALPLRTGEDYYVQRGKVRPAVVLSTGGIQVPRELRPGREHWQTAHTLLIAPYYGADPGGTRGGWPARFVERIRRAEYPQYVWDRLPVAGVDESILRLDHLFPIGADAANYRLQPFRLSAEAVEVLDEWVAWLVTGTLAGDTVLATIRSGLLDLEE